MEKYTQISKVSDNGNYTVNIVKKNETDEVFTQKMVYIGIGSVGVPPNFLREISIMKTVEHINVVELSDVVLDDNTLSFFYKYVPLNLRSILSDGPINIDLVRSYSLQLLCGLYSLHIDSVVHRDIKPENLLIDDEGFLKISNFYFSKYLSEHMEPFSQITEPPWYKAPELLFGSKSYDKSIDTWSAACVIVEMIKGRPLFQGSSDIDQIKQIFTLFGAPSERNVGCRKKLLEFRDVGNMNIDYPDFTTILGMEDIYLNDLLSKMFRYDPGQRLSILEAMKHPFFYDVPEIVKGHCIPSYVYDTTCLF